MDSHLGYDANDHGYKETTNRRNGYIHKNESKKPSFRSDRYQFTVMMQNLNFDVPQDVPQDKLDARIMDLIRRDSKISTEKIALVLAF